ncbi:MAG: site-specific DNA-methyltransferase [Candidatus Paceibacterota bacterium]|jgi:adenine-specific DNA-methyltransferase
MAEKLEMMSNNIIQENIDYIAEKFPNVLKEVTENGKLVKKIDFDVLKQELSTVVIDDKQERYQMTWPDKKKSILLANSRINATLRPIKEKSVDFDNTQNLYIEGDNLDVLKLLRETYLGKIKMIYIDPPYNTGNDFVYEDDFSQTTEDYLPNSGQFDQQGNRLFQNTESSGRFHTDWLNMIYPRLKIAKDLLSEDGVIFVSIDDNEQENLKKIMNEVYGEDNFVTQFVWEKKKKPSFLNKNIGSKFEYIVVFAKNRNMFDPMSVELTTVGKKFPLNNAGNGVKILTFPAGTVEFTDKENKFSPCDMSEGKIKTVLLDEVIVKNHKNINDFRLEGEWRYSQEKLNEIVTNGECITISKNPFRPNHEKAGGEIKKMHNLLTLNNYDVGSNEDADAELRELFDGNSFFDYAKPTSLISLLVKSVTYNYNDITVLDFFSGSATTAQSVMKLNAEDNGNRKFIMVQLPESTGEGSEGGHLGYNTICDIGEERIRRSGKKIKEETGVLGQNLDIGFRVLKLDSSNMNDVYYNPNQLSQNMLDQLVGNVKEDRTPLDLLFQVMLELGVELSAKIEEKELLGKKYFVVNENDIVACFDDGINDELVKELAKIHSIFAVFKDSAFASDSANINCDQIFKSISPSTTIKVV